MSGLGNHEFLPTKVLKISLPIIALCKRQLLPLSGFPCRIETQVFFCEPNARAISTKLNEGWHDVCVKSRQGDALKFNGKGPIYYLIEAHLKAKESIMKKEDMIKRILRSFEYDFFKISSQELDKALKDERQHLNEKTYSEVEALYYTTA